MAQDSVVEIRTPVERIHEVAVFVLGHRIDSQIAARQIVLEGDIGRCEHLETPVSMAFLAFGAGESVLLAGIGMQEHREIGADLLETELDHLLRRRAGYDPISVLDLRTKQAIPYRAADLIHLHGSAYRGGLARVQG